MRLPDALREKLDALPEKPGVYLMRDRGGRVIYVGKAASLRKRVRSYFRPATLRRADPKLRGLVHAVADLDTLELRSEAEAILVEGRLIKEYRPRYNVDFRDDKRFLLLRVDPSEPLPRFDACRIARDDGKLYFGPYASSAAVRAALDFLDRRFGLRRCRPRNPGPIDYRHCHNDILRFCTAPCVGRLDPGAYRARVEEACAFLRGERPALLQEVADEMRREAEARNFEKAAALRDTYRMLRDVIHQRARARLPRADAGDDIRAGLAALQSALEIESLPRVIEAYDISTISGTFAVGSLVCAVDGIPRPNRYRRFRIRTVPGADDPAMMAEMLRRRFAREASPHWSLPDLVVVDGGITQARAARHEAQRLGRVLPIVGLAKQFEELHADIGGRERVLRLPLNSPALRVLRRLRDEAHRFALQYHRGLRARRLRESALDEIEGVGPNRKQALLRHFGSVARLRRASVDEIAAVPGIGPALARLVAARVAAPKPENSRPG